MMGKLISLSFLLSLFAFSPLSAQEHDCDRDFSTVSCSEMHRGEWMLNYRSNPATNDYDLKYYRAYWTVDPADLYITGEVTAYFQPLADNFLTIHFDLAEVLTVDQVWYHGQPLSSTFSEPFLLKIDLPQEVGTGVLDSITIRYQGEPFNSGFGSFATSTHQGTPVLWTLSEPYGSRDWWPCKHDLNDKIDSIDIYVQTPAAYRAASNGKLVAEWDAGSDKVYHWKHRYPIPAYLVAIAVTDYAVYSDWVPHPQGDIEVLNYVFPENLTSAMAQTADIVEIMQLYNEMSGRYPFADEKYGHAQFGWGGGMEHQTMSFMGGFSYSLQAHELAHQWFGDRVTCGSWADIWLNEGFATYWTALTYEMLGNPTAWNDWKSSRISQICSQPGGSVWVDDTTSVNRIFSGRLSYSKGAYLLHMLRWMMGDEAFFQATRNYLEDPALSFGYALTEDLQAHLEVESGLDLQEFFDDWYKGQGYPSYQLLWDYHDGLFFLIANQTQSHSSVSFFEMPLPVKLSGAGQDTIIRLEHTQNGELFAVPIPFEVTSVQFDPELWILSTSNTLEKSPIDSALGLSLQAFISVAPNPGSGQLEVSVLGQRLWLDRVRIFDATGRLVDDRRAGHSLSEKWDTAAWPAGSYLIFVETGEGYAAKWWVKK